MDLEKEIILFLENISNVKNWNFEDCVCLKRYGGFWCGNPEIIKEANRLLKKIEANKNNKKFT